MAPSTRSKPAASKKKDEAATAKATFKKLDASVANPPQIFVLPKDASPSARIVTMPNPATNAPSRYFVCPERGFFEFTRIAAPKRQHRSWLLAPNVTQEMVKDKVTSEAAENGEREGYVLQAPDMFVATPIDPLFLLLPTLADNMPPTGFKCDEHIRGYDYYGGKEYLDEYDWIVKLGETSPHLAHIFQSIQARRLAIPSEHGERDKLEQRLDARIAAVCDEEALGDQELYALDLSKVVQELVSKARRMTVHGLPGSMDDRFVKQALDVPVLSIKREDSTISVATEDQENASGNKITPAAESQDSNSSGTSVTTVSTGATSVSSSSTSNSQHTPDVVIQLLRLRVALGFLLTSYVSPKLRARLQPLIEDTEESGVDFGPLNKHLEHIEQLKKEAQALRSLSDNISRKRSAMEDDEDAIDKAEAKKRKKEEEENRKKNVSHGVKKLLKADTSGMKKLSSFFSKPQAKK